GLGPVADVVIRAVAGEVVAEVFDTAVERAAVLVVAVGVRVAAARDRRVAAARPRRAVVVGADVPIITVERVAGVAGARRRVASLGPGADVPVVAVGVDAAAARD